MSNDQKIFTAEESLAAIQVDPSKILTIKRRKDEKVHKNGTKYLDVRFNIGTFVGKPGRFSFKDVPISRGLADPADTNDPRNDPSQNRRNIIQTTAKKLGPFGQFLILLNRQYMSQVNGLIESKWIFEKNKKPFPIIQTHISENAAENAGGELDDPIVRFTIDWKKYSDKHYIPELRGQTVTQFLDFRTRYIETKGERSFERFKPAMVTDPQTGEQVLVTEANQHLFVTNGSIIRRGRTEIDSITIGKNWISMDMTLTRTVIEPGQEGAYSDEVVELTPEEIAAAVNTVVVPTVQPTGTAGATEPVQPVAQPVAQTETGLTEDELNAALNEIGEI
jgi:hypothetical protein